MQNHQLIKRLFNGIKWNLIASFMNRGSLFASNIITARLLGRDVFGELAIIQTTVMMITGIAQVAMGTTATKYTAELRFKNPERVGNILGLCTKVTRLTGLFFSFTILLFAPWIANYALNSVQLTHLFRIVSIYIFFTTINGFQIGVLSGMESFDLLARLGFFQGIVTLISITVFTWLFGIKGTVAGLSLTAFVTWIIYQWIMKKELSRNNIKINIKNAWKEKRALYFFALPTAMSGIIGFPANWIGRAWLVNQPHGYEQLAIFTACYNLSALLLIVPSIAIKVITPVLNNLYGSDDQTSFKKILLGNTLIMTVITLFTGIIISVSSKQILKIYGEGFDEGSGMILFLTLGFTLQVFHESLFQQIYAKGNMWWHTIIVIVHSILFAGTSFFLIPDMGAKGLAISHLIAYFSTSLLTMVAYRYV